MRRDRVPDAFAGAGDRAEASQLAGHQRISSEAIRPPSSLNACWSSTGLPGKSPATLTRTMCSWTPPKRKRTRRCSRAFVACIYKASQMQS